MYSSCAVWHCNQQAVLHFSHLLRYTPTHMLQLIMQVYIQEWTGSMEKKYWDPFWPFERIHDPNSDFHDLLSLWSKSWGSRLVIGDCQRIRGSSLLTLCSNSLVSCLREKDFFLMNIPTIQSTLTTRCKCGCGFPSVRWSNFSEPISHTFFACPILR